MKTLLVTSAAGFIGSIFVHHALAFAYRVVFLESLTHAGHRENLADLEESFELVVDNIRLAPLGSLLKKIRPSAIVNFAAENHFEHGSGRREKMKFIDRPLGDANGRMLWILPAFAHGFCVLGEETADVTHKVTGYYNLATEGGIALERPSLAAIVAGNQPYGIRQGSALAQAGGNFSVENIIGSALAA